MDMEDLANRKELPGNKTLSSEDFDANIYPRLIRGEPDAWADFYAHYSGRLDRFFEKHNVYNENDRDELIQEAMMEIFLSLHTYKPERAPLRNWIYGVAKNRMRQAQTGYSRRYSSEKMGDVFLTQASLETSDPVAEEAKAEDPRLPRLRDALGKLKERDQEILILRSTRIATWDELAEELGQGSSTVKMRYFRALTKLKEVFKGGEAVGTQ